MPTPDTVASDIMDSVAALLNDVNKNQYGYAAQLPYLKIAMKELRERLELGNIPITNETSLVLSVPAGTTVIGFTTVPTLPADLVEIQELWERFDSSSPFTPMVRKEFLPHYLEGEDTNKFLIYEWSDNQIKLLSSSRTNDLKIDYIAQLFDLGSLTQNSIIGVINADSFLHYKTAALCARFIGEEPTRSQELLMDAELAMDRLTGIENKAKQGIVTRHRPFRASWKSRGLW